MARHGARSTSLLLLLLCACKEPVAGKCHGAPGSLCITVRSAAPLSPPIEYALEVRVGPGCHNVPELSCLGQAPTVLPEGCKVRCARAPAPARLFSEERMFTAEIDLSTSPGPGSVVVRLLSGGACLMQGRGGWQGDSPAGLFIELDAASCPPSPRACRSHKECGGPDLGQICRDRVCVPPDPDVCPAGMAFIPAGEVTLGNPQTEGSDPACRLPGGELRRFTLTQPFCIDETEATVGRYKHFLRECDRGPPLCNSPLGAKCTFREGNENDDRAVNCITHEQAQAFCQWRAYGEARGQLPTEAEWEWVAGRAGPKWRYPFLMNQEPGDVCDHANARPAKDMLCENQLVPPVRPPGRTPRGDTPSTATTSAAWPARPIHDLAGNLAEWVSDSTFFSGHNYCDPALSDENPKMTAGDSWLFRGGSYDAETFLLRTFARDRVPKDNQANVVEKIGVRCILRPRLP